MYSEEKKKNEPETVSLAGEFKIYKNKFPSFLSGRPVYIQDAVVMLCTAGRAEISVYTHKKEISVHDLLVIMPGELVCLRKASEDFRVYGFNISGDLFDEMLSGVCRFSPDFYIYVRDHFLYPLKERGEVVHFIDFFRLLYNRATSSRNFYSRESVIYILRILYLDLYNDFRNREEYRSVHFDKRKEELAVRFFHLMVRDYKQQKDVAYYAARLGITPKYLTAVVKGICGKSPKECIAEYALMEIKVLLKNTPLDIREIAARTEFCNQSALGRFFKQHTGMTPSEYRAGK